MKINNLQIKRNKNIVLFLLLILTSSVYSQIDSRRYKDLYVGHYAIAEDITLRGNSYDFMKLRPYLGALNVMIKETNDEEFIYMQITLINNLISSSQISNSIEGNVYNHKDEFKGWIVHKANDRNKNTINKEIPLFESYSFFYVAELLYLLKENGWVNQSQENRKWWEETVWFVEQNIWTKWRTRSYKSNKTYNQTLLRSRTHMGSHWAGIASYLHAITNDNMIKEQTIETIQQYDKLLKRNLKVKKGAYIWNSTYDDVSDTDVSYVNENIVQDVAHGNHVISYVVVAYELGNKNWTKKDLCRFSKTVTKRMYNKKTNTFADNVDGSVDAGRPGWGNSVGDGWVRLGIYNKKAGKVFRKFSTNEKLLRRYNQNLQFKTTFLSYDSPRN